MSEQKKSWNNVSKRKKKKRQYTNKKRPYSKNKSLNSKSFNKNIISKDEFPSLTETKASQNTFYHPLVWKKVLNKNTIYVKAKNGSVLINSYPKFHDSPEYPLFQ